MTSVAAFNQHVQSELDGIRAAGLFKSERIIATPQGALVKLADGRELINLCANNYLGLSSHPKVIEAAHEGAAHARLRPELGALHLRHAGHPQGARSSAWRASWAPRTPSSTPPRSTPTAACSSRCWARTTPSSATR